MQIVPALSFYDNDIKEESYFETRIYNELGITDELNTIELIANDPTFDTERREKHPIFFRDKHDNICIRVYRLDRRIIYYTDKKSDNPQSTSNRELPFVVTRLKHPNEWPKGNQKYNIPKGAGTNPFMTPGIIEKYEKKEEIKTLVLTEGYFKAFKGYMHGLDIIGLSSITHFKDKDTEMMYRDVIEVINVCKVKNVIMLYDADCRNISLKDLQEKRDLLRRPDGFLNSIKRIAVLLKDYNVSIFFAAIENEDIEDHPKGLDDLYISFKGRENIITDDLLTLSKPAQYFHHIDVTGNTTKVIKWFHTYDIDEFYKHHQQWIKDKNFIFRGTEYKRVEKIENGTTVEYCEIVAPSDVKEYFQVGDNYYKFVKVPNKHKQLELRIEPRNINTFVKLIGKRYTNQIPYYDAFCNVPDHVNFQPSLDGCFNLYNRFEHEAEEGDCSTILMFTKHIFGYQYELGLDYVQLLYQQPWQKLPILCLVSAENQTGKSTFVDLMKAIFTGNCVSIGNDDLSNQFNFSWAGKLLICCEESFIEKKAVIEKIKALATGNKILSNRKGKDHNEIDFFGKFILCSNNEDNFIIAGKNDERYWVIKVPVIKSKNPNILKQMIDEIPAFLHYLNNRKLATKNEDRMWFKPEIRRTEALEKLIEANKGRIESELELNLREMFLEFGFHAILLTPDAINLVLFNKKYGRPFLIREIKKAFNPKKYVNEAGEEVTHRFYWPKWDENNDNEIYKKLTFVGSPYIFKREDFLKSSEIKSIKRKGEFINDFTEQSLDNWILQMSSELKF